MELSERNDLIGRNISIAYVDPLGEGRHSDHFGRYPQRDDRSSSTSYPLK